MSLNHSHELVHNGIHNSYIKNGCFKIFKIYSFAHIGPFQALSLKSQDNRNDRRYSSGSTAMRFDRPLNGGSTDYPDKQPFQFNSKSFVAVPQSKDDPNYLC